MTDPRDQRIADLESIVAKLVARIAELEAQLGQNSRNSSKPPSSDPPWTQRPSKEPSGRKPGGQPGHKGAKRELLPPEKVDVVVPVAPKACANCGGGVALMGDGPEADRHQVIELPAVQPHVTECQLGFGYCRCCGEWTRADLPTGVPESNFGPRLMALVGLCTGKFRMSKRVAQEFLSDVLGIEVALGSVSNMGQTVSEALAAPVEEARSYVPRQATAFASSRDSSSAAEERRRLASC